MDRAHRSYDPDLAGPIGREAFVRVESRALVQYAGGNIDAGNKCGCLCVSSQPLFSHAQLAMVHTSSRLAPSVAFIPNPRAQPGEHQLNSPSQPRLEVTAALFDGSWKQEPGKMKLALPGIRDVGFHVITSSR